MEAAQSVTKDQFIAQLEFLQGRVIDPNAGIFGPQSMFWRVARNSSAFVGGGRAVLLQTAHPWVANGVKQHSRTMQNPISRFRGTFTHVFKMVFGNLDQVIDSALKVHNIHHHIVGSIEENSGAFTKGSKYQANEINALIWVHATLWEGAVKMHELVVGPLTLEEKEQFYQESKIFAYLFGIPESALPPNWHAFLEYNQKMWSSDALNVQTAAREIAHFIFSFNPLLKPFLRRYQNLTSMLMPEPLREQYDLPAATAKNQRRYQRDLALIRKVYRHLPDHLKYMPPYMEAQRRLKGKSGPGLITGSLNKIILGQSSLVSV